MSLILIIAMSLIGWVSIIILHAKCNDEFAKAEMVKDGNNLFMTAVLYIGCTLVCMFISISWIRWVAFAFTAIFAIPPLISCFILMFGGVPISQKISALLNTVIPAILSVNILITYCLK